MSGIVEFRIRKKMKDQLHEMETGERIDYIISNFIGFMEALEGSGLITGNEQSQITGWYIKELVKFQNRQNHQSQSHARQTAAV